MPAGLTATAFHAMGTTITVILPDDSARHAAPAVRQLFDAWERRLSRFLPESELTRVNAAGAEVAVSPLFLSVLEVALAAARATGGIYDPTLQQQMVRVGYDRTFEALPAGMPPLESPAHPGGGWREIRIDRARGTVSLPDGAGLDFGGIAKGMAVDAARDLLAGMGAPCGLVNAGGDLAVLGIPPGHDAWQIRIDGRMTPRQIALRAGALATSGVANRHWRQGDRERHHLLDPRTGEPAMGGIWSVTAVMPRCQQAEVAAKVAFILGPEEGRKFLEDQHITALIQMEDGRDIRTGDWPEHDTRETLA